MTDIDAFASRLSALTQGRTSTPRLKDGVLTLVLDVGGLSADERAAMEAAVRREASTLPDAPEVRIAMTAERRAMRLIAVASGKGGVGKSTVSANLAVALHRMGVRVGLVDADIYGPSQPRLLDSEALRPEAEDKKLIPVTGPWGIPMLSMGHLVKPGQAIAWRGPMAGSALGQLVDAHWGDVDTLVVDMPPGTGDVQISMIQKYRPAGAVIVSTPQDLALMDARRAVSLFETAKVPIIGLVENMAGYACPHCGEISDPFGKGGAEVAAHDMGLEFMGRIPLALSISVDSDAGRPPATGDGSEAQPFHALARRVTEWLAGR